MKVSKCFSGSAFQGLCLLAFLLCSIAFFQSRLTAQKDLSGMIEWIAVISTSAAVMGAIALSLAYITYKSRKP